MLSDARLRHPPARAISPLLEDQIMEDKRKRRRFSLQAKSRALLAAAAAIVFVLLWLTLGRSQPPQKEASESQELYVKQQVTQEKDGAPAESLGTSPIPLTHLSAATIQTHQVVTVDMRPYHVEYWTGQLESHAFPTTRLPLYPVHDDPAQGLFYCPIPGHFTLTVRVPIPKVRDGSRESEPPMCYSYRGFSEFWVPFADREDLPSVRYMLDMCAADKPLTMWEARTYFEGHDPPDIFGSNDATVFKTNVTCVASDLAPTKVQQRDQVALLAKSVYGKGTAVLPGSGVDSLGYWQADMTVGKTAGSLYYQPQKEHCFETFTQGFYKTHQEWCTTQSTHPTFHWTPYHTSRALWIMTPAEIHKCLQRPTRLYGDSLMHQFRRSINCLAQGYAGIHDYQYRTLLTEGSALDITVLFPPRDAQHSLSDEEIDTVLQFYHVAEEFEDEDVYEIWAIGMWVVPHVPTQDFARGIHRWFARLKARKEYMRSKPFVTLLTSPASEPIIPIDAGWQTADRAYIWNQLILEIAPQYDIPVIDTFWPTVHRFDARADNAHFCDSLNIENTMLVLKSVCANSNQRGRFDK